MNVKNFIDDVLLEAAIDSRIDSGIVELHNPLHLEVIEEKFLGRGLTEAQVDDIFNEIVIKDGKYPDRQAYNKEGWLVTFPSKDYRDVAIKKGTHFISDPTHGKGGMNLYYKKKGKQKRQSQQDRTISEPGEVDGNGAPKAPGTSKPSSTAHVSDNEPAPSGPANSNADVPTQLKGGSDNSEQPSDDGADGATVPTNSKSGGGVKSSAGGGENMDVSKGSVPVSPVSTDVPPPYAELSVKFAQSKNWVQTPYGEWRNSSGEMCAVVGLTGEVVPVKQVEREEFKLFVQKNAP